jgi:hypothetical protein
MTSEELTGHPAVRSHLLIPDDLHLLLRYLKCGLGNL